MRGADIQQLGMFSYVSVEERVPQDHPVRKLRTAASSIIDDDYHCHRSAAFLNSLLELSAYLFSK